MPTLADISVALLVGGLGTRLRQAVTDKPKAVASVAGSPFISRILRQLETQGFRHVVLCTGYLAKQVREVCGNSFAQIEISYSEENEPLGTAGALALARNQFRGERTLIMNGDSYIDCSFDSFIEQACTSSFEGTLLLTEVEDATRYGKVLLDSAGAIRIFREKGEAGKGLINAGVYLLKRSLLEEIPTGVKCSLENEMFPQWVSRKILGGVNSHGRFIDIGTPESYQEANELFKGNGDEI